MPHCGAEGGGGAGVSVVGGGGVSAGGAAGIGVGAGALCVEAPAFAGAEVGALVAAVGGVDEPLSTIVTFSNRERSGDFTIGGATPAIRGSGPAESFASSHAASSPAPATAITISAARFIRILLEELPNHHANMNLHAKAYPCLADAPR